MRHNSQRVHCASRILVASLVFVCSILLWTSTVKTSPATLVIVEPGSSSAVVGQTFFVNLTIVDVENLYGVDVTLSWNLSILTLVSYDVRLGQDGGVLNAPVYIAENLVLGNRYTVSASSTSPALPFNGTGNIVCLNFSVIGIGACKLDLQTELYDYPPPDRDPRLSLPIAHEDVDGFFQGVVPEFPYSVFFAVAALLMLFAAVLSKRISSRRDKGLGMSAKSWEASPSEAELVQVGAG